MRKPKNSVVYVIGAGFSAGLGFPTIKSLLQDVWSRLPTDDADQLADVIRFHHPDFNPAVATTYPNIEQLLSEMKANEDLFSASRPATGQFTVSTLRSCRKKLLLAIAEWFHELQRKALSSTPAWLSKIEERMIAEDAQIISFNWDLILDELLFDNSLSPSSYGFLPTTSGTRILKPHGSLNWYKSVPGRHLKADKTIPLFGTGDDAVLAFKPYRAPKSSRRKYMPLIVPPVFNKDFTDPLFQHIWREAVGVLSTAAKVKFIGFSLADADFHARFILRCGFHNQIDGELLPSRKRSQPTGRAQVTVVDPLEQSRANIERVVGWPIEKCAMTAEEWVASWS
jgi:hypothetical protein